MMPNLLFLHGSNLVNKQLAGNRFIVAVTSLDLLKGGSHKG
jgi:hypothetical protein